MPKILFFFKFYPFENQVVLQDFTMKFSIDSLGFKSKSQYWWNWNTPGDVKSGSLKSLFRSPIFNLIPLVLMEKPRIYWFWSFEKLFEKLDWKRFPGRNYFILKKIGGYLTEKWSLNSGVWQGKMWEKSWSFRCKSGWGLGAKGQSQKFIILLRIAFSKFELALVFGAVLRSS